MTEILSEQMRNLSRRLEQIQEATTPTDSAPEVHLKGNLNAKKLAELLDGQELPGVNDVNKFVQAINIIKQGNLDNLSRSHINELAMAFVALLQADKKVTQQVMNVLRTVSADKPAETVMEDVVDMDLAKIHKFLKGSALKQLGAEDPVKAQELSKKLDQIGSTPTWKSITSAVMDYRSPKGERKGMHDEINHDMYAIIKRAEQSKLIPVDTLTKMMDMAKTHKMRGYELD